MLVEEIEKKKEEAYDKWLKDNNKDDNYNNYQDFCHSLN